MPKVKSYIAPAPPRERLPSDLEVVSATYGPYLTVEQAAKCLHRSYGTVYGFVRAGALAASRTGRSGGYIIPATALVEFARKWATTNERKEDKLHA
jgi:excisionase family DNA binding protein